MALKDIKIPTADVVVVGGGSFAVRGLSTVDIEHLVRVHGPALRDIWDRFVGEDIRSIKLTDMGSVFRDIIVQAPLVVADVIGVAADADEEDLATLRKLPINVQIQALGTVAGMTLSTEGDMGKAMEMAIKLIGGLNGGLGELLQSLVSPSALPSTTGSGASVEK